MRVSNDTIAHCGPLHTPSYTYHHKKRSAPVEPVVGGPFPLAQLQGDRRGQGPQVPQLPRQRAIWVPGGFGHAPFPELRGKGPGQLHPGGAGGAEDPFLVHAALHGAGCGCWDVWMIAITNQSIIHSSIKSINPAQAPPSPTSQAMPLNLNAPGYSPSRFVTACSWTYSA